MVKVGANSSLVQAIGQRLDTVRSIVPEHVTIIAITKKKSVEVIRAAYELGLRHFGESRVQEAIAKQDELTDLSDITWHLIGHLQSNKAAKAIERFDWIHSLDSLKLAQRLNQLLEKSDRQSNGRAEHHPQFCLQVKMVPDPNKAGWTVDQLWQDLDDLSHLSQLNVAGLMTIPPLGQSEAEIYTIFSQAKALAEALREKHLSNIPVEELSMGMSADYPIAVKAGATMVRLGRTLFGEREP